MIDLLLSLAVAVLGVVCWVGVHKAMQVDDMATVARYLLALLMLGVVASAHA